MAKPTRTEPTSNRNPKRRAKRPAASRGAALAPADARWVVRVGGEFEAAHFLREYVGGPEPLHGHSWRVEIALETDRLLDFELSVDFVPTRALVRDLAKRLDYGCINEVPPFTRVNPTAENIARWFAGEIRAARVLERANCRLVEVTVWEGPHNRVTWEPRPANRPRPSGRGTTRR